MLRRSRTFPGVKSAVLNDSRNSFFTVPPCWRCRTGNPGLTARRKGNHH
jgi:hypothetical protein